MLPIEWGGLWSASNASRLDGNYCLRSIQGKVDSYATFTANLSNSGQISFYYLYGGAYIFEFYIDNVKTITLTDSPVWTQCKLNVTAGEHTFMWKYHGNTTSSIGYIDYIVITK